MAQRQPSVNGVRADSGKPSVRLGASGTEIVGSSPALLSALEMAHRIAPSQIPILVVGETGTGKELLARYIHERSGRVGALVDVDCGALPDDLVESLLFGHRRGAFTGALDHAEGLVTRADKGTLFLDELGSLPLHAQAKLLRVLETGVVRPVGDSRSRRVDFRLVTTVQENLPHLLASGRFRSDLLQRVAGAVIRLPTLAERNADIVPLARHFAECEGVTLSRDAEVLLQRRAWPGNVRELRWTVARSALFQSAGLVDASGVRQALELGPATLILGDRPEPPSRRLGQLSALCAAHRGDPELIATALGIGRSTLYRRLKNAGLELQSFKGRDAQQGS